MTISTHVLDTSAGHPAQGVLVVLDRVSDGHGEEIARATTNEDGRVSELSPGSQLSSGVYRLTFLTGAYFERRSVETFYPSVAVTFHLRTADQHHHVPLLLSPFGYSTYRGS